MFKYDLKKNPIPDYKSWGNSIPTLVVDEQLRNDVEYITSLSARYKTRDRFDPYNINNNRWSNETMRTIYEYSYSLRGVLATRLPFKLSKLWLTYWEIYSICFVPQIIAKIQKQCAVLENRTNAKTEPGETRRAVIMRGIPFRSVHIHDDSDATRLSMSKVIPRIELATRAQLTWQWFATYTKTPPGTYESTHRDTGVDNTGLMSIANMRGWKNKIRSIMKIADIIVIDGSEDDRVESVIFTLLNLTVGGSAIINLQYISSSSIISIIHLFACCFDTASLIHIHTSDTIVLCGNGFLDNIKQKAQKLLFEYCELSPDKSNQTPFTAAYINSDEFISTVSTIIDFNNDVMYWRLIYYEKLMKIYLHLTTSESSKTFDNYQIKYLEDQYKDKSSKWIESTGFAFAEHV